MACGRTGGDGDRCPMRPSSAVVARTTGGGRWDDESARGSESRRRTAGAVGPTAAWIRPLARCGSTTGPTPAGSAGTEVDRRIGPVAGVTTSAGREPMSGVVRSVGEPVREASERPHSAVVTAGGATTWSSIVAPIEAVRPSVPASDGTPAPSSSARCTVGSARRLDDAMGPRTTREPLDVDPRRRTSGPVEAGTDSSLSTDRRHETPPVGTPDEPSAPRRRSSTAIDDDCSTSPDPRAVPLASSTPVRTSDPPRRSVVDRRVDDAEGSPRASGGVAAVRRSLSVNDIGAGARSGEPGPLEPRRSPPSRRTSRARDPRSPEGAVRRGSISAERRTSTRPRTESPSPAAAPRSSFVAMSRSDPTSGIMPRSIRVARSSSTLLRGGRCDGAVRLRTGDPADGGTPPLGTPGVGVAVAGPRPVPRPEVSSVPSIADVGTTLRASRPGPVERPATVSPRTPPPPPGEDPRGRSDGPLGSSAATARRRIDLPPSSPDRARSDAAGVSARRASAKRSSSSLESPDDTKSAGGVEGAAATALGRT